MDEEALFKTRLSVDERVLKRCIKRFHTFLKALNSNQSSEECDHLYDLFKIDLLQTEVSLSCLEMTHVALEKDENDCEVDLSLIEDKIMATEKAILISQQILNKERKASSQKLEYNSIIKKIQEHHSRESLNNLISDAQTSITALESERESQHQCSIATKEKLQQILDSLQDFHGLVTAVENSPAEALLRISASSNKVKTSPVTKIVDDMGSDSVEEIISDSDSKSRRKTTKKPHKSASRSSSFSSSPKVEEKTEYSSKPTSDLKHNFSNSKRNVPSPSIEEGEWIPRSPKKPKT